MSRDARLCVDTNGCIVEWNCPLEELTGVDAASVVGHRYEDVIGPLQLSPAYRRAALECVRCSSVDGHVDPPGKRLPEVYRISMGEDVYVIDDFPLPLPLGINRAAANPESGGVTYFVELIMHTSVDAKGRGVLQGREFTLRSLPSFQVPTLKQLCARQIGYDPTDVDGSLTGSAAEAADQVRGAAFKCSTTVFCANVIPFESCVLCSRWLGQFVSCHCQPTNSGCYRK